MKKLNVKKGCEITLIITITNTKGGVGKTYLSTVLAQLLARETDSGVCAVSVDPNGCHTTLIDSENDNPLFPKIAVLESVKKIPSVDDIAGYSHAVIDMPPGPDPALVKEAIEISDIVMIPFTPERHAYLQTLRLREDVENYAPNKPCYYICMTGEPPLDYQKRIMREAYKELYPCSECPFTPRIWTNIAEKKPFDTKVPISDVRPFLAVLASCRDQLKSRKLLGIA